MIWLGLAIGALVAAIGWLLDRQRLVAERARLAAELDASRRAADEQARVHGASDSRMRESFAAMSRDAIRENSTDFLQHAGALLQPVKDTLQRVQTQLGETEAARAGTFGAVTAQLRSVAEAQEQLRHTTDGLSRSLKSPNIRGRWGEIQLRRIVELAGMLEQCDFVEKETATTGDGARQTPDLIVKLPGQANLVIDAKVPIDAYLLAAAASDESERARHLASHARQVREHVRALGAKEYWKQFQPAPEFVVMFLPIEPLLAAAFEEDGTLLEMAAGLRVIPATPMTLLALLRAVAQGWQQQAITRNAEEIQALGRDLYDRLATMVEHLEKVGTNIKQAADAYDRFVGSLEQKVLPGARRFKEMGVSSAKTLEAPDQLSLSVRRVTRPELAGADDERETDEVSSTPLLD